MEEGLKQAQRRGRGTAGRGNRVTKCAQGYVCGYEHPSQIVQQDVCRGTGGGGDREEGMCGGSGAEIQGLLLKTTQSFLTTRTAWQ